MLKYNRNTNYLGEILIYSSFAVINDTLLSWLILISIWIVIFIPNILVKDFRLSKKKGFNEYKK